MQGWDPWAPWHSLSGAQQMQEEVSGEALKLRGRAPEKQAALMETSQWLTPPPLGFHGDRIGGGALAWLLQQMWPVQGWWGWGGWRLAGSPGTWQE